jgi:hypothetical protein
MPKNPIIAPKMFEPSLCHYCNKNKLDPNEKYFLPNGIQVCKECAARHGAGTAKQAVSKAASKQKIRQAKSVK